MCLGEETPKSNAHVSHIVILGLQITANQTLEGLPGLKSARQASQTVTFSYLVWCLLSVRTESQGQGFCSFRSISNPGLQATASAADPSSMGVCEMVGQGIKGQGVKRS